MNILTKLTLWFTTIVASILILFSILIYIFSATYRSEEFLDRLENRAVTSARLLVSVIEVDKNLLRIIDQNSVPALPQEEILVFDGNDSLIYSSQESPKEIFDQNLLMEVKKNKLYRFNLGTREAVGVLYQQDGEEVISIASAYDLYGRNKLRNLSTILLTSLPIGILLIVLAGRWFAKTMLSPLANMNAQVSNITAGNLAQRIDEGNRRDEIALLAMNFNRMLHRIEMAFEVQRSFVSNASHELRTPLAAMQSQLQVTLEKVRHPEEYQKVLQSLFEDTKSFTELTTGLLHLAQSGVANQDLLFSEVRLDEVLFTAQEDLARRKPAYHFQFAYDSLPEDEAALTVKGNEQFLIMALTNLMDNACKFSPDQTVYMSLAVENEYIEIHFRDNGFGIPSDELSQIFSPFHRGENVKSLVKGHGIGLSLCKKIIEVHNGELLVKSTLGKGSHFTVRLLVAAQS
jgi:signal transduction histidine kinase